MTETDDEGVIAVTSVDKHADKGMGALAEPGIGTWMSGSGTSRIDVCGIRAQHAVLRPDDPDPEDAPEGWRGRERMFVCTLPRHPRALPHVGVQLTPSHRMADQERNIVTWDADGRVLSRTSPGG